MSSGVEDIFKNIQSKFKNIIGNGKKISSKEIEKSLSNNKEFLKDVSLLLLDLVQNNKLLDEKDIFNYIRSYGRVNLKQQLSLIYYYLWTGGIKCRENKNNPNCIKAVEDFVNVLKKYPQYFKPFLGVNSKVRNPYLTQYIDSNPKDFLITLSSSTPGAFIIGYMKNQTRKVIKLNPTDDILKQIQMYMKDYMSKGPSTQTQAPRPQVPSSQVRSESRLKPKSDKYLYDDIPSPWSNYARKEEVNFVNQIVNRIFKNQTPSEQVLIWTLRWIGVDCSFTDDKICQDRFNIIQILKDNTNLFRGLFTTTDNIAPALQNNKEYGYLILSRRTPGVFNYVYMNDANEIKAKEIQYDGNYNNLINMIKMIKPIQYIDKIEKLGTCIDDKLDKEMEEFIVQLEKIYKDLKSNPKNKEQFFQNELSNIKKQSNKYYPKIHPDKFSGKDYPPKCGDLFKKIKGSYDNINNLE